MKTKALDISTGQLIDITEPDEVVNDEENLIWLRTRRNEMLAQSDWVVIKEREEGGSVSNFADWKEYRQKLRDITNTYKSLEDVKWPTAPSE
jgi:hypothetical protein|tara:strand:- start:20 stop:295 length:276 start_codon:yes stop_codon:yes gene_type:complete